LLLAFDAVFPAVRPEAAQLGVGVKPWQQIIRYRRDRVVATKSLIEGLLFAAHFVLSGSLE